MNNTHLVRSTRLKMTAAIVLTMMVSSPLACSVRADEPKKDRTANSTSACV